ncbi:MAG: hypothetical protein ONB05_02810, partial [candidate division KSB1 bacterium]|nr:hypothetical protein [candidate division KSB1 bacterium]
MRENGTERTLSLNGIWHLTYSDYKDKAALRFAEADFLPTGWLEAKVPGEVHLDLMRHGKIQGYDYALDKSQRQWVEEHDWWYWRQFFVPKEMRGDRVELVFEGLDTFATVWLNGQELGESNNMFLPAVFDVTEKIRFDARNVLAVRLRSAVKEVANQDARGLFSTTTLDRIPVRKAQMNYSWDFCGRQVSCGIWRDVELRSYSKARLKDVWLNTVEANPAQAVVDLQIELELFDVGELELMVALSAPDGQIVDRYTCRVPQSGDIITRRVILQNPQLWWPWELGQPNLYFLLLLLFEKENLVLEKKVIFGIRTLKLIQEPLPETGSSFYLSINGRRFFVKGANWVPINAAYGDITATDYQRLLRRAREGNLSMLRIWGGGIYENDSFYELCDEMGILVFHDFMFACGVYPQDQEFLDLVRREAEYQVRRLRNHPCLALWCGDNEGDQAYLWARESHPDDEFFQTHSWQDNAIVRQVLPEVCQRLDPARPYIPSSPFSSTPGADPNLETEGDCHHYFTSPESKNQKHFYKNYGKLSSRFESEFGFCSLPHPETFRTINFFQKPLKKTSEDLFYLFSGKNSHKEQPDNLDEFIFATQLFHAHGLKYAIEHFRRRKGECGGILYWKFNDPLTFDGTIFPGLMCTVDFHDRLKIAYYYARRAYEPVLISFAEPPSSRGKKGQEDKPISLWVVNDLDEAFKARVTWQRLSFMGNVLLEETKELTVPADSSLKIQDIPIPEDLNPRNEYYFALLETAKFEVVNFYFPLEFHELYRLDLPECHLDVKLKWNVHRRQFRAV